ncbi:hypothetical protein [Actinoallomurus iriomotensis]|uniref:Transporter n=1 Tax=Actinoallomurus iriomotensis TaxID=478107 RepID=A0A9W6VKC7_9ACTN|nr:hypothetical protein [Actinoallomurus iriomotensis]GLY75098.1 transporter [Actinoallomurus iriomotensis]
MTTMDMRRRASLPRFGQVWVIWRQHRAATYGLLALLASYGTAVLVTGLRARSYYDRLGLNACRSFTTGTCQQLGRAFTSSYPPLFLLLFLLALPAAFGAFVGGPLVARELETGTYRFAWTQGAGRTRWIVTRLLVIGAALFAVTAAYGPLYTWWIAPYEHVLPTGFNNYLRFEFTGVLFPVHTLLAFAIGVLAGVLVRRTVVAVAVTFTGSFALVFATVFGLRRYYMTPLTTTGAPGAHDWALDTTYRDSTGRGLTGGQAHDLYLRFLHQLPDPNAEVPPGAFRSWLQERHYSLLTSYHPAGRFWPFQFIETGWMVVLTVLLGAFAVWLIRRRTS